MYFKDLLRYRKAWLGVAMLWIILFHLPFDFAFGPLNYLHLAGYGGVDICFFASGIGCFYSLTSDADPGRFMQRRLKRLVPTYLIFVFFWLIYQYTLGNFNLQMALGNMLAIQYLTGLEGAFNWYISAIFLFYLLAPYFKIVVDRASTAGKFLFILFLLAASVPFWKSTLLVILVIRLVIFYLGMLFADLCRKSLKISPVHIVIAAVMFLMGFCALSVGFILTPNYLWSHGLHWYPFILITPPMCMTISWVMSLLQKMKLTKPLISFLDLCGDYSFEIYLIHLPLIDILADYTIRRGLAKTSLFVWLAGIVVLIACCFILRRLTDLFEKITHRAKRI